MPHARCPKCDAAVEFARREERGTVRCPECDYPIRRDGPEEDNPGERSRRRLPSKRPAGAGRGQGHLLAYYRDNWPRYAPILVVVPLSLLLLFLGFFLNAAAGLTVLLGLLVLVGAFVWSCVLFVKEGHTVAIDYLEPLGPIRFLVILGFCGLYLMGYVGLLVAAQVSCAIQKPRVMVPWLLFQVYGVFLLFSGPMANQVGSRFRGPPPQMAQNKPNAPPREPAPWVLKEQRPDKGKQVPDNKKDDAPRNEKNPDNGPPKQKKDAPQQEKNPDKGPPKEKKAEKAPPAKVTGDAALDKALDDLERGAGAARQAALELLIKAEPNQHRPAVAKKLAALAKSPDDTTQKLAVRPLGRWATREEMPVLIGFLEHKDVNVRNETLQFVGKHRDARAVTAVVRCYREFSTRYHGEQALKDLGPVAEKEVLLLTMDSDFGIKTGAFRVIKEIGTELSKPAMEAAAKGDITTQDLAQQALKAINERSKK
jgi:hypothetical protein